MTNLVAVRGAIGVDANTPEAIREAVAALMATLIDDNQIDVSRILTAFYTVTPDLTALNPAQATREVRDDWSSVPMLCGVEPATVGAMTGCLRVLLQWADPRPNFRPKPAYLGRAQSLRPDVLAH